MTLSTRFFWMIMSLVLALNACDISYGERKIQKGEQVCQKFSKDFEQAKLVINSQGTSHEFNIIPACTHEEMSIGLSKHTSLPDDEGMLFEYPEAGRHSLTMSIISFSLDFIVLDKDWKVVGLHRNLAPFDYGNWGHDVISRSILAVRGGLIDKFNIAIGDQTELFVY